jgi:hypothetical protein
VQLLTRLDYFFWLKELMERYMEPLHLFKFKVILDGIIMVLVSLEFSLLLIRECIIILEYQESQFVVTLKAIDQT